MFEYISLWFWICRDYKSFYFFRTPGWRFGLTGLYHDVFDFVAEPVGDVWWEVSIVIQNFLAG